MTLRTTPAFALPDRLSAKSDPLLISRDEKHFAAITAAIAHALADLAERLDEVRRTPEDHGTAALERDQEVHRLSARLRTLRRYDRDLCLGRFVVADAPDEPVYVGRLGLTDAEGRRLLVDWRSPAAEPFFAATRARPLGLVSRRRYRWTLGQVTDYWDEVLSQDGPGSLGGAASLDDESAFIASLGAHRSGRMRDVLGTIQADQDAIIRAGSRGTLVVDGGPGTGKTVVALHRAAYLLHADPRLAHRRGRVLVVGPHQPYLTYVADVLPSLGEDGVLTCTLADLVPEGAEAVPEPDPEVARLKSSAALLDAVERAVGVFEEPPTDGMEVETPWADLWVGRSDWAEAFAAPEPGVPHNEARDQVWEALLTILVDKLADALGEVGAVTGGDGSGDAADEAEVRRVLRRNPALVDAMGGAWPILTAPQLVADLWAVPAYLRACAPWLSAEEVRTLRRAEGAPWTVADLPLLDAARRRLGDPEAAIRDRRRAAARAAQKQEMDAVVDHLVTHDDSEMKLMSMLRVHDLRDALADVSSEVPDTDDRLAGPFAHVVVDEAQELSDAEWQMLLARCPSRSLTVVGDRAQARQGFRESWEERLSRVGLDRVRVAPLTVNYRTPEEVMAEAAPVIRAAIPDANVPTSVRRSGVPVEHAPLGNLEPILDAWLAEHPEGTACVIGAANLTARPRVQSLTPTLAKGLEFDLVVLASPPSPGVEGAVDRYVAMTRATQRLVVLT